MGQNKKLLKILIEDSISKIMMNCPNGLLMMKKNTISRNNQLQNKSSISKKKD